MKLPVKLPVSVPKNLKQFMSSKTTLYAVFVMALLQWLYLLTLNRFDLIIIFGLISFVLYKFQKNMIVVLGVPLIVIFFTLGMRREGFEGSEENDAEAEKDEPKKDKKPAKTAKASKKEAGGIVTPVAEDKESSEEHDSAPEPHNASDTKEATENNADPEFDHNQINYASTLTKNMQSYNELLGSDGFAKMSQDTQLLLQQQEQLGNAMKQFAPLIGQMAPFLEKANGLLNNVDMKQINKVAGVFKDQ